MSSHVKKSQLFKPILPIFNCKVRTLSLLSVDLLNLEGKGRGALSALLNGERKGGVHEPLLVWL